MSKFVKFIIENPMKNTEAIVKTVFLKLSKLVELYLRTGNSGHQAKSSLKYPFIEK